MKYSKYTKYYTFDKPVPYKTVMIFPAKLEDYIEFYTYVDCLLLEIDGFEGSVEDKIRVIQMKYLDFLFFVNSESNPTVTKLYLLLCLLLQKEDIDFKPVYEDGHIAIFIDGEKYTWEDFDEIRNIICEQNLIDLPDLTIQKEIRDSLQKAQELKSKEGTKMTDMEGQILTLVVATGMDIDSVYALTLRKFRMLVDRMLTFVDYKILSTAKYSGFVEFKDKSIPVHFMADLSVKKDIPDGMVLLNDIQEKISK